MTEIEFKAWKLANPDWKPDIKLQTELEIKYQSILLKHI